LSVQRQFGQDWLLSVNYIGNTILHLINEQQINPALYFFNGTNVCTLPNGMTISGSDPVPNDPTSGRQCSPTGNTNQRRVLNLKNPALGQYYGIISTGYSDGTGNYNAMYVQIQKRLSRGTTVLANYTWSHCISDLWNGTQETPASPTPRRATAALIVGRATTAVYKVRTSVTSSIFPPWRRCRRSRTIFCDALRVTGSSLQS